MRLKITLLCLTAVVVPSGIASAQSGFQLQPLKLASGDSLVEAYSINDAGQITARASAGAVLYQNGTVTSLMPPGYSDVSWRPALSETGVVAGIFIGSGTGVHPYSWQFGTGFTQLPIPQGANFQSGAVALNSAGTIVGFSEVGNQHYAAVWSGNQFSSLFPGSFANPQAYGINSAGDIAGFGDASDGHRHALFWHAGNLIDLGTFGASEAFATNINDAGQVLVIADSNVSGRLAIWQDGKVTDLPALGFGYSSYALDLNDLGQIVGSSSPDGSTTTATLWQGGHAYALNDLIPPGSGWVLENASDINNLGQIVANGTYNGQPGAVLLTPVATVPEPGVAAASLGLAALALRRRRR